MRKSSHESQLPPASSAETQVRIKTVHKRGLLDVLDIHACAGSEIGGTKQKIKTSGSKDGIPYEPSLKSMLFSSSSDESLKQNKTSVSRQKIIQPNKNSNQFIIKNNDESLFDASGEIDYLIPSENEKLDDIMRHRRRPFTHNGHRKKKLIKDGSIVSDIIPEQSNESLLDDKWSLNFIDRANSRTVNKKTNIHSTLNIDVHSTGRKDRSYDEVPSLDVSEKDRYFKDGSRGVKSQENFLNQNENVIDYWQEGLQTPYSTAKGSGDESPDCEYNIPEVALESRILKKSTKRKPVLQLFDCNQYPLTDSKGNILQKATGQNLVIFKNRRPHCDIFRRLLLDKNGETSLSPKFEPYSIISKECDIISKIPLYDFRGYPLLDYDGSSLINANGAALIITNKEGKLLHDINEHPIYDKCGIPITQKDNCWLTTRGLPYRVFDKLNYPLTNNHGIPLLDVSGRQLLRCDQYGRPVLDYNCESVIDSEGLTPTDPNFNPTFPAEFEKENVIALVENKPVKIFNKCGLALTEESGMVLKDARGKYLLKVKYSSVKCSNLINDKSTILHCSLRQRNDFYHSMVDKNLGEDGTKCSNRFYNQHYQEPIIDRKGEYVYDVGGRQLFLEMNKEFSELSCKLNSKGSYQLRYQQTPCSSSDSNSMSSYMSDQRSGYYNSLVPENLDVDLQIETDAFGRPLYDLMNRPLFDKYGRPMFDLFSRPLYDLEGRPIANAEGKLLRDKADETKRERIDFNEGNLREHSSHMLLEDTERNVPLFDSNGHPLYNKNGKPLKDAFGRLLYDDDGTPLCNEDGLPASKQIKQKGIKIDKVEDKFQMLIVTPEDSTNRGIYNDGENILAKESAQHYNARVRITTLVDGERVIELLEIAPAFNVKK